MPPSTQLLDEPLLHLSGNDQLLAVHDKKDQLSADYASWKAQLELVAERNEQWHNLQTLMHYCRDLAIHKVLEQEVAALKAGRTLLANPSPVSPLLNQALAALRCHHGSLHSL